jgi:DNA-binding IclR family transcriptional regulator
MNGDMTNQQQALTILSTLYRYASRGKLPTITKLSIDTGLEAENVTALLSALDRAGLVDAAWPRLTLAGLATAVAAGARTKSKSFSKAA